jgi:hypothetical protein
MEVFLWAMLALLGVSTLGKLIWLATGVFPPRKAGQEAVDVVIHFAVMAWAVALLVKA